jgi:pimeloyl-ACP methyl ester carboxylesterase
MGFFQLPLIPEFLAQWDDFRLLELGFRQTVVNKNTFTDADITAYKNAFAKAGSLTAAINYYRNPLQQGILQTSWTRLEVPTLMIWGEQDVALGKELTYGTDRYVRDFRIHYIANSGHWVQQEQPQLVNHYIREFVGGMRDEERGMGDGL